MTLRPIHSPDDPALDALCEVLHAQADALDASGGWPRTQLVACREAALLRALGPAACGGLGWSEADVLATLLKLARACLSTAFVLTQPLGVMRRLVECENELLKQRVLPKLIAGETFASVGIAHLTTSRRHATRPPMMAIEHNASFTLDGLCPWVSGGVEANHVVTGAALDDGRQVIVVLPTDLPGVIVDPPWPMLALSSTQTGSLRCESVQLPREWVLAGPAENVLSLSRGVMTGSLQTSTLALGVASAAVDYLRDEANRRADLATIAATLQDETQTLIGQLLSTAAGRSSTSPEALRRDANLLVLRATQAALTAAKGTGFLAGHPVGRWCREALFFLVWSCPQPVASATLCALSAGYDPAGNPTSPSTSSR